MYTLYWDRGNANMAPHALLIELAQPYRLARVDLSKHEQRGPDYLRLNPNARVPTMTNGAKVMFEAAAIMLFLCENHPDKGLMPAVGDGQRHLFLQWLVYLTNTVQEEFHRYYHPDYLAASAAARAEVKTVAERRLDAMFSRIDSGLAEAGPHLLGERFSAADIYLVMLCRWARNLNKPATAYPAIRRLVDLVSARPAWAKMMAEEGITWDGRSA